MTALRPMPVPRQVEVTPIGTVRLVWNDGHVSNFLARDLRARCPCATCVDEWTGQVKVDAGRIPPNIAARKVQRVGNYALSFTWSDGHSTGIYAYDHLRRMCRCSQCVKD
ncbi:MAG: DUF971 domain-containing protein [Acidobacteriota bacterium]